jgi:signal transduction histidine kinase
MEVRARVRRALPRPSPRVRLAWFPRLDRVRERREVVEVLGAAERARLLREFVAARARERRALWERLHDEVLQTTAGNLLRLDAARMLLEEGRVEEARALLAESARTERQVFDDLRRLMAAMNVEPSKVPSEDPLQVLVAIPEPDPAPPVG